MSDQTVKTSAVGPSFWVFVAAALVVIIAVFVLGWAVIRHVWPVQGVNLGDAYEGLAALFSGLAFIGVIYALAYQRAELKLQREELALTREEMGRQRQEMETQNATLAHQRFENSFFQLLRFQRESMQSLHVGRVEGAIAFYRTVSDLSEHFVIEYVPPLEGEQLLKYIDWNFMQACASDKADFGHYFRTLYHLIEFVDESTIENKPYYVGLVRAQLSTDEITLLFYNGLSEQGGGFKSLIEKYALLKNWNMPKVFQIHRELYPPEAYG